MNVLVTGGAGFIGSHLCDALVARGDPNPDELAGAFAGASFDAVLHVAGQASIATSFSDPGRDLRTNVVGTLNVIDQCVAAGVPRLVYASSMTVYGEPDVVPTPEDALCRPVSYYGVTKYAAERYVHVAGARTDVSLSVTSLRMFNVYGERQSLSNPYQGVLAIFIGNVLRGEPITIHSDGRQTRDFVYVADAVDAWLRVLDTPATDGAVYNVGSGRETPISELAEAVLRGFGQSPDGWDVRRAPAQAGDQRRAAADVSKLARATGWKPRTGLDDGMARTIEWGRTRAGSGTH